MKGVILAAGRGERLKPLTDRVPKPLIKITDDKTCIDFVIDALKKVVDEIVIVVGYMGEKVGEYVLSKATDIPIKIVKNPSPQKGNLTSLLCARPYIEGESFILTNVDHIFPSDFYTNHFKPKGSLTIAGQSKKSRIILEDDMKIKVDESGRLLDISKDLKEYDGAYIGVSYIAEAASEKYWNAVDKLMLKSDPKACVEDVMKELIKEGIFPKVQWLDHVVWFELDTIEDLKKLKFNLAKLGKA